MGLFSIFSGNKKATTITEQNCKTGDIFRDVRGNLVECTGIGVDSMGKRLVYTTPLQIHDLRYREYAQTIGCPDGMR